MAEKRAEHDEYFAELREKHPDVWRVFPACGFSLPDGWQGLVRGLSCLIQHWIKYDHEGELSEFRVEQVKEKFGGLRFYVSGANDSIHGAISLAEILSVEICERCGEEGEQRSGGWIVTLCDSCHETRQEELRKRQKEWEARGASQ